MIEILYGHENTLWSESLASVLSRESDIKVVGEANRPDEILGLAMDSPPDVVVLALYLTEVSVVGELCHKLSEGPGQHRVLVLHERDMPLAPFAEAFRSSPKVSFMGTCASAAQFLESVRQIACGHLVMDSDVALGLLRANHSPLTAREREVLSITHGGATPKEIASKLQLSVGTVRNYLANACAKLGARNRIEAIRVAQSAGWI
ncbi:DNA-binding response regulator [Stackebrandtia nassauensis]|uniref:Transcriptional regulator, LuxR family n=1 Tax=Stackebrandtia nassauensis (strain DSM 44728 / CIP 108903 / NRRL B-16338 / NBRC 102104 / LLR-40K-21) TaxID=446470 RepID=D3Q5V1_STANL|nr:response regulator transcription factor [Stackebrandtia nassauensis]ADD40250.1 transcriptional regulator, LuxR family [Stackebrandtia nassauensis DSM 44728]